jgi:hypothetical protein
MLRPSGCDDMAVHVCYLYVLTAISVIKMDLSNLYDNEYTSMNTFFQALALQNILDTLSEILVKCLRFALIKIESVSIFLTKPRLASSFVYTFLLKML